MTDRASAEGLRELRDELVDEQGDNYPLYDWVIRFEEAVRADERALRDTGSRPDSGVTDRAANGAAARFLTGDARRAYIAGYGDGWSAHRLSTPRTETSDD